MGLSALGRGGLEEVRHHLLSIRFRMNIDKGIETVGFLHVQKIQHPDLIALLLQKPACGTQQLTLGVKHHKAGVALHQILHSEACGLAGACAADHGGQKIPVMLRRVQADLNVHSHGLVVEGVFVPISLVDLMNIAPLSGTMLLSPAVSALVGESDCQSQCIEA